MSENQIELNNNRKKQAGRLLKLMPDVSKHIIAQMEETYKDGAIDSKTKRLMATAIALGLGCRNCILGQAEAAIDSGASKEEFLETISVVLSIKGTTGMAESIRLIQFLDELEKL